jgi:hypothetical protein
VKYVETKLKGMKGNIEIPVYKEPARVQTPTDKNRE